MSVPRQKSPRRPRDRLGLASILGAAFVALTLTVVLQGPSAGDLHLLEAATAFRSPDLTMSFRTLSWVTGGIPVAISSVAYCLWLLRRSRRWASFFSMAMLGAWAIAELGKLAIARPRPFEVGSVYVAAGYGYPSGHALGTAALLTSVFLVTTQETGRATGRALLLCAGALVVLLVGVSRVYLGVHYPSDVVGGWLLGVAWPFAAFAWLRPRSAEPAGSARR